MPAEPRLPVGVGPGAIIAERYRLLRAIGEGNMGIVFEAEMQNGARVALKVLPVGEGASSAAMAEARARFLRESALSFSIRAPHVVAVHDHGIDGRSGVPFMVMDLLVGEDLEAFVKRVGALEPEVAVRIFMQACEGLTAAHAMGIVHRDIKPSNLFLCRLGDGRDARIDVRVCDFGAAKVFGGDPLTRAGALVGTPLFIAPEQLRNAKDADARSDVWSLGMSLYFALAGAPALDFVKSFAELATVLVSGAIPSLQKAAPWVAPELARVVHGTILTDVKARCPSARDFGAMLARCHSGDAEIPFGSMAGVSPASRAVVREIALRPLTWGEIVSSTPLAQTPAISASAISASAISAPVISAPVISAPVISVPVASASATSASAISVSAPSLKPIDVAPRSSPPPAPIASRVPDRRRAMLVVVAVALVLLTALAVAGALFLWRRFA